ncbi:MAG: hypothetical protein ACTSQG_00165 [Promethearchaeota archaeon]
MQKNNSFKQIFEKYDTDKAINYSKAYNNHLTPIRKDIKLIFEIGVNRGGSVRAWKEFFPNALIVGIDIDPQTYFEEERIRIEIGSGTDKDFMTALIKKYGEPDIIIDDGSHFSSDIKASFALLYDSVKTCYIIEDYGTQFPYHLNGFYINDDAPATSIIHKKIDQLLFGLDACKSIQIYYSIAFIFKE